MTLLLAFLGEGWVQEKKIEALHPESSEQVAPKEETRERGDLFQYYEEATRLWTWQGSREEPRTDLGNSEAGTLFCWESGSQRQGTTAQEDTLQNEGENTCGDLRGSSRWHSGYQMIHTVTKPQVLPYREETPSKCPTLVANERIHLSKKPCQCSCCSPSPAAHEGILAEKAVIGSVSSTDLARDWTILSQGMVDLRTREEEKMAEEEGSMASPSLETKKQNHPGFKVQEVTGRSPQVLGTRKKVAVNSSEVNQVPSDSWNGEFIRAAKREQEEDVGSVGDGQVHEKKKVDLPEECAERVKTKSSSTLRYYQEGSRLENQQASERNKGNDPRKSTEEAAFYALDREEAQDQDCEESKIDTCTNVKRSFQHGSDCLKRRIKHKGKKAHKCSECGKNFSLRTNLRVHERTHTGEKPYKCSDCGRSFTHSSSLKVHEKIHSGVKPYVCTVCGKTYYHSSSLTTHERLHTGENVHRCPHCEKVFTHSSVFIKHVRIHTGEKPFKCSDCGKSFSEKGTLLTHEKTHTGERPFQCPNCERSFSRKCDLIAHERIHTEEDPYKCLRCGKSFSQKSNLVMHERIHTDENPYACSHCGKRFRRKGNLMSHMRIHTGEKPYQCTDCGKRFCQRGSLTSHEKTHSREKRTI
ncbi:zinc finger protein ZFP2-like isoform X2 [Hemicordylus capensis]|uniref:zinc finger protein ZFP2-like isoform X2 n=1 Tax=Hemicordylus capensis TaxID=884348 RepID=UPI0023031BA7|nr:zinc finger protein ZFP2-like isoform X2 [Hemicordylus capensis]